jgi:hypothetical protein
MGFPLTIDEMGDDISLSTDPWEGDLAKGDIGSRKAYNVAEDNHTQTCGHVHAMMERQCAHRIENCEKRFDRQDLLNDKVFDKLDHIPDQIDARMKPVQEKMDALSLRVVLIVGGGLGLSVAVYILKTLYDFSRIVKP